MSHAQYLRDLLRPLGVYDLTAPFNGGELDAQGEALDAVCARLEDIQKEASLATAEGWGLEKIASLLTRRPVASQPRKLAAALAAMLRIGGDSFTPPTWASSTISGTSHGRSWRTASPAGSPSRAWSCPGPSWRPLWNFCKERPRCSQSSEAVLYP